MEASLIAQWVNNPPAMQRPQFNSCVRRSTGEGIGYPLQSSWTSLVAQLVKVEFIAKLYVGLGVTKPASFALIGLEAGG